MLGKNAFRVTLFTSPPIFIRSNRRRQNNHHPGATASKQKPFQNAVHPGEFLSQKSIKWHIDKNKKQPQIALVAIFRFVVASNNEMIKQRDRPYSRLEMKPKNQKPKNNWNSILSKRYIKYDRRNGYQPDQQSKKKTIVWIELWLLTVLFGSYGDWWCCCTFATLWSCCQPNVV